MKNFIMNRRRFLANAGTTAAAVPLMMNSSMAWASEHLASQQLRTVGLSVTVQERILNEFKNSSGIGSVSGKAAIFPDTQTELLSGSRAYDCWEIIGERLPAMTQTDTIRPIDTKDLKNWDGIRPIFNTADPRIEARAQISGQIWADDAKSKLWMVPTVYNFDSIGYRPDLVSAEEANTWTALFDPKFRGKTGLNVDPLIAIGQAILAMNTLKLLEVKNPGNPNREEINEAVNFLIAKKKRRSIPRTVG